MAAHAVGFDVDAVGAVEVLDHAGMRRGDHLAVMTADEAAVDLHVVVGGARDDGPSQAQGDFLHRAAGCSCSCGGWGRAPYSTHCSSRTALMMSARVTLLRSEV